jgi:hypothetical protein
LAEISQKQQHLLLRQNQHLHLKQQHLHQNLLLLPQHQRQQNSESNF